MPCILSRNRAPFLEKKGSALSHISKGKVCGHSNSRKCCRPFLCCFSRREPPVLKIPSHEHLLRDTCDVEAWIGSSGGKKLVTADLLSTRSLPESQVRQVQREPLAIWESEEYNWRDGSLKPYTAVPEADWFSICRSSPTNQNVSWRAKKKWQELSTLVQIAHLTDMH